ncbi:MAG: hypothetical protein WBB28_02090 [Crinalium sp.]
MYLISRTIRQQQGLVTIERSFTFAALRYKRLLGVGSPAVAARLARAARPATPPSNNHPGSPAVTALDASPAIALTPANPFLNKLCRIQFTSSNGFSEMGMPVLYFEIPLLYDLKAFSENGGNLFLSVKSPDTAPDTDLMGGVLPLVANNPLPLPAEPAYINNLQEFLGWLSWLIAQGAIAENLSDMIKIVNLDDKMPDPVLLACVKIPLDWNTYLSTGNLVAASKQVITKLSPPATPNYQVNPGGLITDSSLFRNYFAAL